MKLKIFFFIFLLLFIALLVGCENMQSSWQKAQTQNSIEAYEDFLQKYPNGKLADKAQFILEELIEEKRWSDATSKGTIESFSDFIKQYPEGKFTEKARTELSCLIYSKEAETVVPGVKMATSGSTVASVIIYKSTTGGYTNKLPSTSSRIMVGDFSKTEMQESSLVSFNASGSRGHVRLKTSGLEPWPWRASGSGYWAAFRLGSPSKKAKEGWILSGDTTPEFFSEGSELVFTGGPYKLGTAKVTGDRSYPLLFRMVKEKGLMYIAGRGSVETAPSKTQVLGKNHNVASMLELSRRGNNDKIIRAVAWALGWLPETSKERSEAQTFLEKLLESNKSELQLAAAESLMRIGDKGVIKDLKKVAQSDDQRLNELANAAIERILNRYKENENF